MSSQLQQLMHFLSSLPRTSNGSERTSSRSSPAHERSIGFEFEERPDQLLLNFTERFRTPDGRMIADGPQHFKKSVVEWVKFHTFELQEMYAFLREREEIVQRDIDHVDDDTIRTFLKVKLAEIQAQLIWMAHNVTGTYREIQRRRRAE